MSCALNSLKWNYSLTVKNRKLLQYLFSFRHFSLVQQKSFFWTREGKIFDKYIPEFSICDKINVTEYVH